MSVAGIVTHILGLHDCYQYCMSFHKQLYVFFFLGWVGRSVLGAFVQNYLRPRQCYLDLKQIGSNCFISFSSSSYCSSKITEVDQKVNAY